MDIREKIKKGEVSLGIEFGSTRIKAVLIDDTYQTIADGWHEWENQLVDGVWTYSMDAVWSGVQDAICSLKQNVETRYNEKLTNVANIGISAMMHGYLAFDKDDNLLVPFRTWRNSMTAQASEKLTELFQYNIPERWSIAHLYQAILNNESHVEKIDFLTTLAGYVHYKLTGEKVLGVGDASGMFPIDNETHTYDAEKVNAFDEILAAHRYDFKLLDILPASLSAGAAAGTLTEAGARLLDPTGDLQAGAVLCPPEGDAGTGMVATNSVKVRTGNVSSGTSVFAMIVLEEKMKAVHPEIDLVTTPVGDLVAMVHANNCSSDLNAWVNLFEEFADAMGVSISKDLLFKTLFNTAMNAEADGGGLMSYGYLSGENITKVVDGRPMFVRTPSARLTLGNFMRTHLMTAFATIKIGMDILATENVKIDSVLGHGGIFRTPVVAQSILATAMNTPVSVMETASEGGAWGIAILASYMANAKNETLTEFLDNKVFANVKSVEIAPNVKDVEAYDRFIERYKEGIPVERLAGDVMCDTPVAVSKEEAVLV
jgi:sugar (pentulose or hexulose) kinase